MNDTPLPRRRLLTRSALAAFGAAVGGPAAGAAPAGKTPVLTSAEQDAVAAALGKKGRYVESEAVYTVPLPRADLSVKIKGAPVPTPLGFGGWVSVKRTLDGRSAVLMSDTVLLQEEVNPLIDAAHAAGLEVSAIHNHFFYEEPRVFYMHLHGMVEGADAVEDLTRRYAKAISGTKLLPANQPPAGAPPARTGKEIFDLPALDAIVGHTGAVNGPTYKYTIGRSDLTVTAMGAEMTANIGLNTWLTLAGTAGEAHAAGDVAMLEPEVNPVVKALRARGVEVVAMHHHMLGEQPRIVFLHYYGRGPALELARTFRGALDLLGKGAGMSPGGGAGRAMRHGA